tara:strand:+ start:492 stop:2405 length:1914 start_codon:yes stop_codon:yes gene_type:complete
MWKVHLPASSYLAKQTPFFGTNHFLKALNPILLKSAGLTFFGRGMHEPHGWAPSDAGINDDPNEPDHPPWNHDPKTGELLDGGLHPIDFILRDLQQRFGYTPEEAQDKVQQAIDKYNQAHAEDSNHTLPNVDSPQWRKVVVGPYYDNSEETHMRRVRGDKPAYEGGPRPFVTYAYNRGNVSGGATGRWIDSGMIHMNKELGQVLQADGKDTTGLNYVSYNRLLPGSLSGGVVQSISTGDWKRYQSTGQLPDHYLTPEMQQQMEDSRFHPEIHAHQLAKLLPDAFFHAPTGSGGGRGSGLTGEMLDNHLTAMGVDHGLDEEELNKFAGTRAMKYLFQPGHQKIATTGTGGGAVTTLLRDLMREIDAHHEHENYGMHLSHAKNAKVGSNIPLARAANERSKEVVAHMSLAAHKLMEQGMSEEDAISEVARRMREADISKGRFVEEEGLREKIENVIDLMLGASGHENFNLGKIPTDPNEHHLKTPTIDEFGHHEAPEHWHGRIISGEHELAPVGNSKREEEMPPAPAPAPAPSPATVPVRAPVAPAQRLITDPRNYVGPAASAPAPVASPAPRVIPPPQMRAATPLEQAFQQMMGQPEQQTFFDIGSGALVRRSHDINVGMDAIRKKIGYFDGFLRGER